MFSRLYPEQSEKFLQKRIDLTDSPHSFYRAFVPLFYKSFADHPKMMKKINRLKEYVSTIGGDAHFENFGLVADDFGKMHFTINDVDDVAEGELYFDVFRNYISTRYLSPQLKWKDYLSSYLAGIRGKTVPYSKTLQKKIDSAISKKESMLDEFLSRDKTKFIQRKDPARDITETEARLLKAALTKKYPQIEILDQYVRMKDMGGSAGQLRIQVLAKLTPKSKARWMDIKEMDMSSKEKIFESAEPLTESERIQKAREILYEKTMNKSLDSLPLLGKVFSLKYVDQYVMKVVAVDLTKKERAKVALDEAYALGEFHARSLKAKSFSPKEYADDWEDIPAEKIDGIADKISDEIKSTYKKLKRD